MTEMDRIGDVQEIELTAERVDGVTVAELGEELSEDRYIALISREGGSASRTRRTSSKTGTTSP
jgi:hypothetical protein